MKSLLKLMHSIWRVMLLVAFGLPLPITALALSPVSTLFAYDGQDQANIAYDGAALLVFNYDSAVVPIADVHENRTPGASGLFAEFTEFLAAKATTGFI